MNYTLESYTWTDFLLQEMLSKKNDNKIFESYLFVLNDEKGSLDGNWKSFYHNGSSSKYWIAAADWLYIKDEGEIFYILMTLLKDQRCYTDLSPILNE